MARSSFLMRELHFFLSVSQVTMTQAMQFSAFKGPFAERIDVWNAKLYMVSKRASVPAVDKSPIKPSSPE